MKKNMGTIDRVLRVTVAVIIGILYLTVRSAARRDRAV